VPSDDVTLQELGVGLAPELVEGENPAIRHACSES
jgi:hypothetical protein